MLRKTVEILVASRKKILRAADSIFFRDWNENESHNDIDASVHNLYSFDVWVYQQFERLFLPQQ